MLKVFNERILSSDKLQVVHLCSTCGVDRNGNPDEEGRARLAELAQLLRADSNALSVIMGHYTTDKGRSISALYDRYFQTNYPGVAARTVAFGKSPCGVDNLQAYVQEFVGQLVAHNKQVITNLITNKFHAELLGTTLQALDQKNITFSDPQGPIGTSEMVYRVMIWITKRDPFWQGPGKIFRWIMELDQRKFRKLMRKVSAFFVAVLCRTH